MSLTGKVSYRVPRAVALTALVALASPASLTGQATNSDSVTAVSFPCSFAHKLKSRITGRTYPIDVGLPPRYCANPGDTTHFPTLYLLDNLMRVATPWYRYRALGGDIKEPGLIMVGIGWPAPPAGAADPQYWRMIEYFTPQTPGDPVAIPGADSLSYAIARNLTRRFAANNMSGKPGEAPAFLRVIREEIIPFIERTYRVTSDRGLYGHSAGGYFAAYALFEAPDLFTRYGISSPSFFWDDYSIFAREAAFARTHKSLAKNVVLVSGEDELLARGDITRMAMTLSWREYSGLEMSTAIVPGGHYSGEGLFKAINVLYPIVR